MQIRFVQFCAVFVAFSVFSGCQSTPTLGDRMSGHGDMAKQLGDDWSRGDTLVKKGTKLQAESDKLLAKGKARQEEAQRMLTEGQELQQSSQVAFNSKFGSTQR